MQLSQERRISRGGAAGTRKRATGQRWESLTLVRNPSALCPALPITATLEQASVAPSQHVSLLILGEK